MNRIILLIISFFIALESMSQIDYDEILGGDKLNTITTAVPFLLISPDSRAGAMGDVGVATNPDANSMHWNPAKLSFVDNNIGISVSVVPWLRELVTDINLNYLSGYYKLNDNEAIGYELRYFSLGNIVFTDDNGQVLGNYEPNEVAIGSAYSRKLSENLSLSIAARYIYSNLTGGQSAGSMETVAGQSVAADISSYYEIPIRFLNKVSDLSFGMNISNIGNKMSYTETIDRDFIPVNFRLGSAWSASIDDYNKFLISFDFNKLLVPTPPIVDDNNDIISGKDPDVSVVSGMFQSFTDAPDGFSEEIREINFSGGMEYWYADQFALRGGYFHEHNTKGGRKYLTFGSGVKYNVFALDFSYLISTNNIGGTNPLANTMRFTLIFDLGSI